MSKPQSIAFRVRWVLLILAILCWGVGFIYVYNAVWPQWPLFPSGVPNFSGFGPEYKQFPGWGLNGVAGMLYEEESTYLAVVWIATGTMLLTQWLFLLPVFFGQKKLKLAARGRPMALSVSVAGLIAGVATVGLVSSVLAIIGWWDEFLVLFEWRPLHLPLFWPIILVLLGSWVLWVIVFSYCWRYSDRYTRLTRFVRALLAGTAVEVLVSTGAHIWVKEPKECYCMKGSYTGLVLGGTVLCWCFGPGIILLFMQKAYRCQALLETDVLCVGCGYDLRGTLAAGRSQCPECGAAIERKGEVSGETSIA